ncbi:zf-HC2 domain-containing protein [Gordonia malaquae]|uniref:anti-sigma factor family protein n=1 Tax=Gordonia malaquae TaxID=410332 RepID=UPI0030FF0173
MRSDRVSWARTDHLGSRVRPLSGRAALVGLGHARRSSSDRWAPINSSIAPNPDHRPSSEFASTEHLAVEAVVAYVDNELSQSASSRADAHLSMCPRCSDEVANQARARSLLRAGNDVAAPASLLGQLCQIPTQEIDMRRAGRFNRRGR